MKKVTIIVAEERLQGLAKDEWVTVRNSLAHGRVFYNPRDRKMEFLDRRGKLSWPLEKVFKDGIDILLSNIAIMWIWNFVHFASLERWENDIKTLKALISELENQETSTTKK